MPKFFHKRKQVAGVPIVTPPPSHGAITINDYVRSDVILDGGLARGAKSAMAPITGSADVGEQIEARVVSETGLEVVGWTNVGAASALGVIAFIEVPVHRHWLFIEIRCASNPAVVATMNTRFGCGFVLSRYGQSEDARMTRASFSQTPVPSLMTRKEATLRLIEPTMTGCQHVGPMKVPGVDPMPAGWNMGGGTGLFLEAGASDTDVQGWDFTGFSVFLEGTDIRIRDCVFGERNGISGSIRYLQVSEMAHGCQIGWCDFIGLQGYSPDGEVGASAAFFQQRVNGEGAQDVELYRCRFKHISQDAIKTSGFGIKVYENALYAFSNLDQPRGDYPLWDAGTSYAEFDLVRGAGDLLYYSTATGNIGNPQPTGQTNNAFWNVYSPHVDPINLFASGGAGSQYWGNLMLRDPQDPLIPVADRSFVTGTNNTFRVVRNSTDTSQFNLAVIEFNLSIGLGPTQQTFPVEINSGGNGNWVPVEFTNNWFSANVNGNYIAGPAADMALANNFDADTGAPISVAGAGVAVAASDDPEDWHLWFAHENSTGGIRDSRVLGLDYTASMATMVNGFRGISPNLKVANIQHTISGTSYREMMDDNDASRTWAFEVALHNLGTGNQTASSGLLAHSWFAAPGAWGSRYEEGLYPVFFGMESDGTTVSFPHTSTVQVSGSFPVFDHGFINTAPGGLYDYAVTKLARIGPHCFDLPPSGNQLTADELARISWREMQGNPLNSNAFVGRPGVEEITYLNSPPDGSDRTHPYEADVFGLPYKAALAAYGAMQAIGEARRDVPEFDVISWTPTEILVGSTQGPITTVANELGLGPITPKNFPHHTDVWGFVVDGVACEDATLVGGQVSIKPNAGAGNFTSATVLEYGKFGATGQWAYPEDRVVRSAERLPIVDQGGYGIYGTPVRPLPQFTNTL